MFKTCLKNTILAIACLTFLSANQGNEKFKVCFGVSLSPRAGGLFSIAILELRGRQVLNKHFINHDTFVLMSLGMMESKANPNKINLFKSHNIKSCYGEVDSIVNKTYFDCNVVEDLWKLRFGENPNTNPSQKENNNRGWAAGQYFPSEGQRNILYNEFDIDHINVFIKDEYVFKLLQKMNDSHWVENYKKTH